LFDLQLEAGCTAVSENIQVDSSQRWGRNEGHKLLHALGMMTEKGRLTRFATTPCALILHQADGCLVVTSVCLEVMTPNSNHMN
jgi:hypothetical protein